MGEAGSGLLSSALLSLLKANTRGAVSSASAVWRERRDFEGSPGDMLELNLRAGITVQLVLI